MLSGRRAAENCDPRFISCPPKPVGFFLLLLFNITQFALILFSLLK